MSDQAIYQFKVKVEEKCTVFFIGPDEVNSFDYCSLVDKVRSFSSRLRNLSKEQLRLHYLDDENTFVYLSADTGAFVEMFRCSARVENADFKRITIKVEESNSPVGTSTALPRFGKRIAPYVDNPSPTSAPSKREKEKKSVEKSKSNASRSLCATFDASGESSREHLPETSCAVNIDGKLFQSPLEKYLEKQRGTLKAIKEKEKQVLGSLQEYQSVIKKKKVGPLGQDDGPMCGNCHRREGHNKLNCPYNECQTVFHCGDINKHSEEKTRVKEIERQHRELLKQISTLENELKVKEASVTSLQDRYVYKVRNNLIESNPSRYLSVGAGGKYVENWFQLNKDARKLQSILKGHVPAPGTNLQRLLTESPDESLNESVLNKGKTSVRNPYRNLWEQRGVQWPVTCKAKELSNTSNSSTSVSSSSGVIHPGVDETTDETPPLSDEYVLSLGIRESLKTSSVEDKPLLVVETELAPVNTSVPVDQTCPPVTNDSTLDGLAALAEACEVYFAEEELLN